MGGHVKSNAEAEGAFVVMLGWNGWVRFLPVAVSKNDKRVCPVGRTLLLFLKSSDVELFLTGLSVAAEELVNSSCRIDQLALSGVERVRRT